MVLLYILWRQHTTHDAARVAANRARDARLAVVDSRQRRQQAQTDRRLIAQRLHTARALHVSQSLRGDLALARSNARRLQHNLHQRRIRASQQQTQLDRVRRNLSQACQAATLADQQHQQQSTRLQDQISALRKQPSKPAPVVKKKATPPSKPAPPRRISEQEADNLVRSTRLIIDNYANPAIGVHTLQPIIRKLSRAEGAASAKSLIALYRHGRKRLDALRQALAINRSGLAQLRYRRRKPSKQKGLVATGLKETRQRRYDWLHRLAEIRTEQVERLGGMVRALLTSYVELSDPQAIELLIVEFKQEARRPRRRRDKQLIEQLCNLFVNSRARAAIPVLIDHLSVRDKTLKALVRTTLLKLCGATIITRKH